MDLRKWHPLIHCTNIHDEQIVRIEVENPVFLEIKLERQPNNGMRSIK